MSRSSLSLRRALFILCLIVIVVANVAAALAAEFGGDVVLHPLVQPRSNTPEIALIFIQGADIKPDQYVTLTKEIQNAAKDSFKVWVGIPEYVGDAVEPLVIGKGIERIEKKMRAEGMTTETIVMAGHSLGGAMVQLWSASNADKVAAQILMGAFLTRSWKKEYIFQYPVPTLTIGGELDGLARVTRIAEAFYTQLLDPSQNYTASATEFPVTVVKGVTHMQFADGEPPSLVFERDLKPEVTYDEAHALIAKDVVNYLRVKLLSDKAASSALLNRLTETQEFITPILDSLHLEGYHNFRPPCLCGTDICPQMPNCTADCPFTTQVSQVMMGGNLEGLTIKNSDSFHDVWETEPTVHLPTVQNSCTSPNGCVLETTTVTQAVYHNGEDLEAWKKHFDVPGLDFGFFPVSAIELRTKMNSRQSIYTKAGVADPDFDELDGGGVRCGEINQKSWSWATEHAGSATIGRFGSFGQPYTIGKDMNVCPAGPCWIWRELQYNVTTDGQSVELVSPQFSTETDFWLPKTRGFHYCKVLSPARAMEWIYVDGLRAKYSLKNT